MGLIDRSDGNEEQVSISVPDAMYAARLASLEKAGHHVQEALESNQPRQSREPVREESSSYSSLIYWPPFWFFIFLVLAVGAIGYATFQQNKKDTRQKEMKLLSTIADLKVEEITKWREERKGDAETLAQDFFLSREVEKWLQSGMPPGESRSMILARMESMHRAYGYREIFLFDAGGKPVIATSPDAHPPSSSALEAVNAATRTQSVIFMDIGQHDEAGSMGVAAPVLVVHDGKPKTIGAIYLQIDLSRFLFPLLKAIPLTSKSMELVLVHREGNEVLFLNIPAANESASLLRQPLSQSKLPAAMAVLGNQMEADGIDYRGVPVFAALRKIPDSDWFLVAKVEQEEIYAPLRKLAWLVAGAIAALIALTGVAVGLWWRNQRAKFLIEEQKRTEKNLRAASAYTRSLIEASLDPLVTISPEGKITDVNKATEEITGLSRSELIGNDFAGYFSEPEKAQAGYRQVFGQGLVHDYPLTIRHQSGRLIDVLYNATVYRNEAGNIQGVFAAARDMTERKQAERDIQRLNRLYGVLSRTNKMIVRAQNRQVLFDEACRIAVDQGLFRMAWIGVVDETTHFIIPVAMYGNFGDYLKSIRISGDDIPEGRGPTGTALREGRHFVCRDIERDPHMAPWCKAALAMGYRSSAAFPLWAGGKVKGVFTVYAPETDWFNDEEIRLLDELTSDISYALDVLEKENLRKQAEEKLRVASLYARSLIETSLDPLVTISAIGKITDVNKATEEATGFSRNSLIGTDFADYFTDVEKARAGYQQVFGQGFVRDYPLTIHHQSGRLIDVLYNATVYYDEAGNIQGVFAAARDITERKRQESIQMARLRLMESAARLSLKELLTATLDEACALTESNIGFYHFLDADQKNLSLQAWSTRTTREFCKAEGEGRHYNIDEAGVWVDCIRARRPVIHNDYASLPNKRGLPPGHAHVEREMVVPIFRKDLIVAILGVGNKATPYEDNDLESITQLADLAWDIAVAKRAEEEARRLNVELEQRVVERTAKLEAANNELEGFAYSVSHDLRVPLRAIDGFSRLVLKQYEERLDDEGKRLLNVVRGNTKRMGQLIDDILAFSRMGRVEMAMSDVDVDGLVRGVMEELKPATGRDLAVEIKPLPSARGDLSMLRQVWVNLLSNAIKFTCHKPSAAIQVGGHTEREENIYFVKDNGVGFDMQYAGKLFGVFQRLHGIDEFEGTGIGLAIVKRIITRHGGRVWAEGNVNEGATFYFALPV